MATTTITRKLTKEVKAFIVQAIYEVFNDPDLGLELGKKAQKRLRRALTSKQKTIPFSEIRSKYY